MTQTVIYIEDNAFNMRLVRRIVSTTDYSLLEAFNGKSGIDLVTEFLPQLVFIDINLPDIDGVEVMQAIKANPRTAQIPCVALTANAIHGDKERYMDAGFDEYLAKPVMRRELVEMMDRFLSTTMGEADSPSMTAGV
ncbi:response regulator [Phototrophicus methaneseepsis]|uniref:Response regulator n=1 Tax=Phototrophicus methaneseepsis TaxID=2710758 RepID=A0A7S8E900_9CHLR|nr:response regulator [Phototrophicus methaneseepsis]QPC82547.1 response regulator [Phototrophicus methaneseepsis]